MIQGQSWRGRSCSLGTLHRPARTEDPRPGQRCRVPGGTRTNIPGVTSATNSHRLSTRMGRQIKRRCRPLNGAIPTAKNGIRITCSYSPSKYGYKKCVVRAEGLEPSRTLRSNGFSYPSTAFAAPAVFGRVWGLDYPFTVSRMLFRLSGAARLVSTPSRPFRAGLGSGSPCYRVPRL